MASPLRAWERATLALFTAVWVGALATRVIQVDRPAPTFAVVNALGTDDYPRVRGFMTPAADSASALARGDRIVRVDGEDARGWGQLRFLVATSAASWRRGGPVPMSVDRGGTTLDVVETPIAEREVRYYKGWLIAFVWGVAAILIRLRARRTPTTQAMWLALAAYALMNVSTADGPAPVRIASIVLIVVAFGVTAPLLIRAYMAFPDEANALHGWNRVWPWTFSLWSIPYISILTGFPFLPEGMRAWGTVGVVMWVIALVVVMTRNYRRSGAAGRRQMRWILYGVYAGSLLSLIAYAVIGAASASPPLWAETLTFLAAIVFPITVLIAVLRSNLFDIDRLLGATVSYNILAIAAVGAALLILPTVSEWLTRALDVGPATGRASVALVLAGVVVVANRRVSPAVQRLLFKERFAFDQAMKRLPDQLAGCRKSDDLWSITGNALVDNLRPASCVIYGVAGTALVPVFSDGESLPTALAADAALIDALASMNEAHDVNRGLLGRIGPAGAALLRNLDARALFVVRRNGKPEALACLGEKRSGDVYTATERSLLSALATTLSVHLLRFDEAELLERSRAIQNQMRRYVPGALAEVIAEGQEVETGEREVSVLFVDIRGYTAYADGRQASDIFSTVNRYTETVSSVVTAHGGVVVEFNGDGMMAVFGAPRRLPGKERAAVRAARELATVVPAMHDGAAAGADGGTPPALSVGVGVATGPALVGNIRAVDRTIWSAIGSTTNLAARLQSLTRELGASVLIDDATHAKAGDATDGFARHDAVDIRGRRDAVTVHALSPAPAAAAPTTATTGR